MNPSHFYSVIKITEDDKDKTFSIVVCLTAKDEKEIVKLATRSGRKVIDIVPSESVWDNCNGFFINDWIDK